MCRIVECFEVDAAEHAALDMLRHLHDNRTDETKVRIYTASLFRLDARIVDWQPLTDVLTGAHKSEHVRRHRLFATEEQLVKVLRQWTRKAKPDALDHSQATRAAHTAGMLGQVISHRQRTAKIRGYNIDARYTINAYGRAYLAWLEAREAETRAAQDALYRAQFADVQAARLTMAGAR